MDLVDELEKKFGRSLTAKELARLLRVNPRTVNQYAHLWGGIKVTPTHYRFFEKQVVEVIENAYNRKQEGQTPLPGTGNGAKKRILQTFPRRRGTIKEGGYSMGSRNQKGLRTRVDGHGLFVHNGVDERVSG
jgi:hypothetical protein